MPAGANPALSRSIGVLLKNSWMQALLRRPAEMQRRPDHYFRPAVFICDEYQAFASVGEDDPSGDEKSFALSRQCRCIPILATQSISSLRSVLPGSEAWRTLIQTLRTRIFLSLSDEASARIASELCGSVMKMKPSYTFTENTSRPEVSLLSARAGGGRGSVGASKSFRQVREPVFQPRDFSLLSNYQAICLPYDGAQSLPARRVYLKPYYLPREARLLAFARGGTHMSRASGIEHLKPFFPGLEGVLEDTEVSELMINGPHNVWIERAGRLYPHETTSLDRAALQRAAIHIARPLGLDPTASPIIDARLADGSRVAICVPPASPEVAITVRRFGGRAFSAQDLVRQETLPRRSSMLPRTYCAPGATSWFPEAPVGQNYLAQCACRAAPGGGAHRGHRGYAGTACRALQLSPFRGGTPAAGRRHHPGTGPARPAPPARSHRGGRGARWRSRRSSASPQYWSRRVAGPPFIPTTLSRPFLDWPAAPCRPAENSPGK